MDNFIYSITTKVYFGKGQVEEIGKIISTLGKKALLVYGGGSIKCNGIYDTVVKRLKESGVKFKELSGVEPNPRISTVRKGVQICRENDIDVILAIGGGSSIDCGKVIATAVDYDGDAWDLIVNPSKINKVLPIVTILTIAATGSEMDRFAVITNTDTKDKIGAGHDLMRPTISILDPTYTYTVNKYQTACGIADIMSHVLENYFNNIKGYFQDRVCESILKTCIHYGLIAIDEPNNYEARANLMWVSSWAINDFLRVGRNVAWSIHPIEHQLSAYYDITHGAGLAILAPIWMKHVMNENTIEKFKEYGINVWNLDSNEDALSIANKAITKTSEFFKSIGLPSTLREVGIVDDTNLNIMAEKASHSLKYAYLPLNKEEICKIYKEAM